MRGILHEQASILPFIVITVLLGGLAAWQMGRSIASTWRPLAIVPIYAFLLMVADRFLHFALFDGTLLSLHYAVVDFLVILLAAVVGWRMQRADQMSTQYSFAFKKAGPVAWKRNS
jgi:phosphoglycerol transferase MdoB-like AlkP superfamily enzyme